ncbi:Mannosyl-oligosaccharide 1,2-alpha-mannosidase IB [Puccinia graminis f. sp. tritici]|uniref:alpha-1,2-Mannosidase n=1 Tax=Puccinia graminis f. sp. tritici TaxID=56615 RepID=A0A5B0RQI2_PUCGR|nr:Mannosyl-oligosaccharide 1,2-alpha-mannosidase IB [Puccinia graminis f. sp. tritici]
MWYGLTSTHSPLRFGRKRQMLLQPKGPSFSSTQLDRQSQIRESFFRTYRMYAKPSWSHAHVAPLSLLSKNPDNEDGATIVDSLTALHIMNLREEFEAALDQTINMDFQVSNAKGEATLTPETTIRCLGAILSTYELLGKNQTKLLHKAQELGNQLQNSWNFNQSAVPYPWLHFGPNQKDEKKTITIAQAASLTLEFNRLSHWTGNNSYRARADESSRHIMNNPPAFPGRYSPSLTSANGPPVREIVRWADQLNSFLEYGIKYWQLVGEPAMYYMKFWQDSVDSLIEHLLQWSPGNNQPYLAGYSQARGGQQSDMFQLGCFAPGNWMLGGKLLQNEAIYMLGLGMAETCCRTDPSSREGQGQNKLTEKKDNQVLETTLMLRPEVAKSIWYAWRFTGDPVWQERAWSLFQASEKHFKATGGYYARNDAKDSGSAKHNSTETFLFGEFFKYLYLTFTERDYLSLDDWVFSQGHPFKIDPSRELGNLREFIEQTKT